MEEPTTGRRLGALEIDRSRKRPRRRRTRRLALLGAALALAAASLVYLSTRPPEVHVAEVRAARPGERNTELTASAYVTSRRRSIVAPKVPGRLDEVLVEEGQAVEEGQQLALLDDDDARVELEQAKAASRSARARSMRAEVLERQRRRDRNRARDLAGSGAISTTARDDAQFALEAAAAERRAAEADLALARTRVDAAELHLAHTVVRAPFAGTIVRKLAEEGAMLAPAAVLELDVGGIVEIVDLAALEVEAEVSEDRLAEIEVGQPALVFLDAYPDEVFPAVTGTVRPALDRAKATAVVKLRFERVPDGALPDMGARVAFLSKPMDDDALAEEARLRVPVTAVLEDKGGAILFEVVGSRLERVPVEVEERLGEEVVLRRGPPPGTRVASAPKRSFEAGQRVRVKEIQP